MKRQLESPEETVGVKLIKEESKPDSLFFYSKSEDVKPGLGEDEHVETPEEYDELAQIPHWRRVLSNFHDSSVFEFRGQMYRSIEHVFQGIKSSLVDEAKGLHFTLNSGHAIGNGSGQNAQRKRKYCTLNKEQIETWKTMGPEVMKEAAIAKYTQDKKARKVLLATGNAQLWHQVPGQAPVRFEHLEEIRASFI